MKQNKIKESRLEKKFYDFLEELAVGENNIFVATTFRDKGRIMSIKVKRVYNNPQRCEKEQPNFHG